MPLKFVILTFLSLSACGQSPKDGAKSLNNPASDTAAIYRNMFSEICKCSTNSKANKASMALDSCYKTTLAKYSDSLSNIGLDPLTQEEQLRLSNEFYKIFYHDCKDLIKLIEKETAEADAKKLLFKGSLVSQTRLPSGLYEIKLKNNKSFDTKVFLAQNPLDETEIKKYEPGYEIIIEYEIVNNSKTGKQEYHLKEFAAVTGSGIQKVGNR